MGGGGGGEYPPRKILNNTKFGQAEGLPELFTEPNLVLHDFWKFQLISLLISWNLQVCVTLPVNFAGWNSIFLQ